VREEKKGESRSLPPSATNLTNVDYPWDAIGQCSASRHLRKAKAAATEALEIDDTLAEAHTSGSGDWYRSITQGCLSRGNVRDSNQ
jgi:hypothetical protein